MRSGNPRPIWGSKGKWRRKINTASFNTKSKRFQTANTKKKWTYSYAKLQLVPFKSNSATSLGSTSTTSLGSTCKSRLPRDTPSCSSPSAPSKEHSSSSARAINTRLKKLSKQRMARSDTFGLSLRVLKAKGSSSVEVKHSQGTLRSMVLRAFYFNSLVL